MALEHCRRRSVPAGRRDDASGPPLSELVVLSAPPSSSSSPPGLGDSGLLGQADALATMTVELNLRAVSAQAERLEQELKELVVCTGQDEQFRRQHEQRVMEVWREIVAVKTQMDHVRHGHDDVSVALDRCRRETSDLRRHVTREMSGLRHLVDTLAGQLDALASPPDGAPGTSRDHPRPREPAPSARAPRPPPPAAGSSPGRAGLSPKRRIEEAISSTRRWHRDHKTTSLPDPRFVAHYLKQQSKRDPPMAVFIQRAIRKHVQRGPRPRTIARPRSLDDFCRDITWADVTDTVEHALVNRAAEAVEALRRLPWPAPA